MTKVRKGVEVFGLVQGVGFRPYVYRLATQLELNGFITNTASGVSIEIEGLAGEVDDFVARLPREIPPLARVTSVAVRDLPANHESGF